MSKAVYRKYDTVTSQRTRYRRLHNDWQDGHSLGKHNNVHIIVKRINYSEPCFEWYSSERTAYMSYGFSETLGYYGMSMVDVPKKSELPSPSEKWTDYIAEKYMGMYSITKPNYNDSVIRVNKFIKHTGSGGGGVDIGTTCSVMYASDYMDAEAYQETVYSRGAYLSDMVLDYGSVPENVRHTDGYWYEFVRMASPLYVNVNGVCHDISEMYVNQNGIAIPINEITFNNGGVSNIV